MAEKAMVTILNQRQGKIVLPPDADELKANPKAKARELLAGQSMTVSAAEAPKYLRYQGLVDLSKLAAVSESAEVMALKAKLADSEAENARLRKKTGGEVLDEAGQADKERIAAEKAAAKEAAKAHAAIMKKGAKVITQAGDAGTVTKVYQGKKGKEDDAVDVLLANGNTSRFDVAALTLAPQEAAS